ncbi:M10 family metallopeptidase C-terminal domain-containing protein [Marinibacterium profundimaris]|uniref:Calcium-binding protein n=1 Tax=Marinibacterium profundimaris TaxID=1679460 RepID=A0A225NK74_9RHOB|nr:hypothetical protein [Marinibacterium profundimaris]OWU73561.1 hypothetical protein ATO3_12960 [Marinibacterium profundimaris]
MRVTSTPLRLGSFGADFITGTSFNDYVFGFFGNDRIELTGGVNRVFAGRGDDTISVLDPQSTNILFTGRGNDVIEITDTFSSNTVVRDFEIGADRIDVSALGITSIEGITVLQQSGSVMILADGHELTLDYVTRGQITAGDFIFAEEPPEPVVVVDFEELENAPTELDPVNHSDPLPEGYLGYTWTDFWLMETDEFADYFPDHSFVPQSGDNVIYGYITGNPGISRDTNFGIDSLYIGSA